MTAKKIYAWGVVCAISLFMFGCSELTKGNIRLDQNKYDEAIPFFETYLETHPESLEAKSRLGFAYFKIGFWDEAADQFEAVLIKKPGEPYSTFYSGLTYLSKGEIDKAINRFEGYRNKKQPLVEATVESGVLMLKAARQKITSGEESLEDIVSRFEMSVRRAMVKEQQAEGARGDSGGSGDGGDGGCGCGS